MPTATIELRAGSTTPEQREAISLAIHAAMQQVLHIPADDRFHFFHELPDGSIFYEDEAFSVARGRDMKFVQLSFQARPAEQKRELFRVLLERLAEVGVGPDEVAFTIVESPGENWWASGRVVNPSTGYDERMSAS